MTLQEAIDALLAYVEEHPRTPDYGDRLPEFNALDTSVYVEARRRGLLDGDLPRKDATFSDDEIVFFGRTNVPGVWDKRPDRPVTLTMMATPGWRADMLALRALAEAGGTSAGRTAERKDDQLPWGGPEWDDLQPQTRRLLRYMNGREKAEVTDLTEDVWGKESAEVKDGAIHVAINKANHFLAKQGHPRTLTKVRGEPFIKWV